MALSQNQAVEPAARSPAAACLWVHLGVLKGLTLQLTSNQTALGRVLRDQKTHIHHTPGHWICSYLDGDVVKIADSKSTVTRLDCPTLRQQLVDLWIPIHFIPSERKLLRVEYQPRATAGRRCGLRPLRHRSEFAKCVRHLGLHRTPKVKYNSCPGYRTTMESFKLTLEEYIGKVNSDE